VTDGKKEKCDGLKISEVSGNIYHVDKMLLVMVGDKESIQKQLGENH